MRTRDRQALLQLVREASRRQLAPRTARYGIGDELPAELFAPLAELDLLGLPFASEDGGGGQPQTVVCDVLAELSRAFMPVGLAAATHLVGTAVVAANAAPMLRTEVLPRLIAGEWLISCGFPPSAAQLSVAEDPLRAERDGDRYVLDGTTVGVSHAAVADCYVLFGTVTDDDEHQLAGLLVPAGAPGVRRALSAGDPASPIGQVVCRAVTIPADHRLGATEDGQAIAIDTCDAGRISVAACAVGLARAALHAAIAGVHEGATGDGVEREAGRIADLAAAVEAADALCQRAAAARDARRQSSLIVAMAALTATDTAFRVADAAARLAASTEGGGAHPVERYRQEAAVLQRVEGAYRAPVYHIADEVLGDRRAEGGS